MDISKLKTAKKFFKGGALVFGIGAALFEGCCKTVELLILKETNSKLSGPTTDGDD